MSIVLLGAGALAALLAIGLALTERSPAVTTPIALASIALVVAGGALRVSCAWGCYGDCDWDEKDEHAHGPEHKHDA